MTTSASSSLIRWTFDGLLLNCWLFSGLVHWNSWRSSAASMQMDSARSFGLRYFSQSLSSTNSLTCVMRYLIFVLESVGSNREHLQRTSKAEVVLL